MRRTVAMAFFLCQLAITAFGQSPLAGRWITDPPADAVLTAPAAREYRVQLEVIIENGKASGSMNLGGYGGGLGGTFYTFKDARVTANKIQFLPDHKPTMPTYTIELVGDNTVVLSHGGLPLVGTNVLDLLAALGGQSRPTPPAAGRAPQVFATAMVRGTVQDSSKALIPGATVTATNLATNAKITTITDEAGRYSFQTDIVFRP
jgi:hypothetical protein